MIKTSVSSTPSAKTVLLAVSLSKQPSKASTASRSSLMVPQAAASFSASAISSTASRPRRACWFVRTAGAGLGAVGRAAAGRIAGVSRACAEAAALALAKKASTGSADKISKTPHSCCQATASANKAGSVVRGIGGSDMKSCYPGLIALHGQSLWLCSGQLSFMNVKGITSSLKPLWINI